MNIKLPVLAAALAFATAAHSTTIIGARRCDSWVDARSNPSAAIANVGNENWLLGYLSGLAMSSQVDVLKGSDDVSLYQWVDTYCRSNGRADLADAAQGLFLALRKQKGL